MTFVPCPFDDIDYVLDCYRDAQWDARADAVDAEEIESMEDQDARVESEEPRG